ncbi:MAG: hypothetical protein IPK80_06980 [Nannocystis sp.]|nr:hypothetical protein [Nannocystis sp.]
MTVRYLFGDSGLFPGAYNFLEVLRGFIVHCGRAALLHAEIATKTRALDEAVAAVHRGLEEVAAYFTAVQGDIDARGRGGSQAIGALTRELNEFAARLHDGTRSRSLALLEADKERVSREIAGLRAELPVTLNAFFTNAPLEVLARAFSMRRTLEAVDVSVVLTHPSKIEAAFALDPDPEWSRPRRVGELEAAINVQIGMKKRFLRSAMVPERVDLSDHIIAGVELTEEVAEVSLRRRLDADEGVLIRVQSPAGEPAVAEIIKLGAGDEVHAADAQDTAQLLRLVAALRELAAKGRRRRLLWVRLADQDVLEHDLLIPLIDKLVDLLAPLAQEIDRRSPNRHELSLKVEHGDGHREEIYLRKDELTAALQGLPPPRLQLFGRLGVLGPLGKPAA